MSENCISESQNITMKNGFMEKFYESIRNKEFLSKRDESITSDVRARIISALIMEKAINPEKDKAFQYEYANIERLNECIKKERDSFNRKFEEDKENFRVIFNYTISINIINSRDCIATVRHTCELYNPKDYKPISTYKVKEEILMAGLIAPEGTVKADDLIKEKGKWITYAKRYALLQFMQPTKLEKDPEESDKRPKPRSITNQPASLKSEPKFLGSCAKDLIK